MAVPKVKSRKPWHATPRSGMLDVEKGKKKIYHCITVKTRNKSKIKHQIIVCEPMPDPFKICAYFVLLNLPGTLSSSPKLWTIIEAFP